MFIIKYLNITIFVMFIGVAREVLEGGLSPPKLLDSPLKMFLKVYI